MHSRPKLSGEFRSLFRLRQGSLMPQVSAAPSVLPIQ